MKTRGVSKGANLFLQSTSFLTTGDNSKGNIGFKKIRFIVKMRLYNIEYLTGLETGPCLATKTTELRLNVKL